MLESLTQVEIAAPTVVLLLLLLRFYAGDVVFDVKYAKLWNVIRRVKVPLIDSIVKPRLGVSVENEAFEDEYVNSVEATPKEVVQALDEVTDLEVSVLAGYKTDWEGRKEAASVVSYHGDRPFPHAPDWLQNRQLHITLFRENGPNPKTVITAHEEANSWRPDLWKDHLYKGTFSAKEGVNRTLLLLEQTDLSPQF